MSVHDFGLIVIGFISCALLMLIIATCSAKLGRSHHPTTAPKNLAEMYKSKGKEV